MIDELILPVGIGVFLGVFPWRFALLLVAAALAVFFYGEYFYAGTELTAGWGMIFAVLIFMSPFIICAYAVTFAVRCLVLRWIAGVKQKG